MKYLISILIILALNVSLKFALAESEHNHDHDKHKEHPKTEHKDEEHNHREEEKHDEHDGHNEDEHNHEAHETEGSHEHGHEEEAFGKGKAITEVYNEGKKFKLSKASEKLLGIKTSPLEQLNSSTFIIPNEALVRFQSHLGVFIKNDDWFELIELKKATLAKGYVSIESLLLHKGVQIVTSGVPLLRVAHLQASGQGGKGHAH